MNKRDEKAHNNNTSLAAVRLIGSFVYILWVAGGRPGAAWDGLGRPGGGWRTAGGAGGGRRPSQAQIRIIPSAADRQTCGNIY